MRKLAKEGEDILIANGCQVVVLGEKERWRLEQRWRETFAHSVKEKTGKWTHLGFDWHAFSYGFTRCLKGAKAVAAYVNLRTTDFVVTPHYPDDTAFRCHGGRLPSYLGLGLDRYVFDAECNWTMVFTHEDDCGPYFCERKSAIGDDASGRPTVVRRGRRRGSA